LSKIKHTIYLIEKQIEQSDIPSLDLIAFEKGPFKVLISCLLSLRTKDKVTIKASRRLFNIAQTPSDIANLSSDKIERLIYPVGFYRKKARILKDISGIIADEYSNKVPKTEEELLKLKGVGRKTANLVLSLGYDIPAICVDTHVHRISNRLGWVKTNNPFQTEGDLKRVLPQFYWKKINSLFVRFGQNVCLPVSPFCSRCKVISLCRQTGVKKHR
jgi:endonuclease III